MARRRVCAAGDGQPVRAGRTARRLAPVAVTNRRTKRDYAEQLRYLADPVYPHVEYIRLVQDNLNTHTLAALYEVFPPAEARRLASRFEGHSTPKHGSWLSMAEVEISVVQRGCLARP